MFVNFIENVRSLCILRRLADALSAHLCVNSDESKRTCVRPSQDPAYKREQARVLYEVHKLLLLLCLIANNVYSYSGGLAPLIHPVPFRTRKLSLVT